MDSPYLKYPKWLVETDVAEIYPSLSASIHSRIGDNREIRFAFDGIASDDDSHFIANREYKF